MHHYIIMVHLARLGLETLQVFLEASTMTKRLDIFWLYHFTSPLLLMLLLDMLHQHFFIALFLHVL
jgi:hypothetical protein